MTPARTPNNTHALRLHMHSLFDLCDVRQCDVDDDDMAIDIDHITREKREIAPRNLSTHCAWLEYLLLPDALLSSICILTFAAQQLYRHSRCASKFLKNIKMKK